MKIKKIRIRNFKGYQDSGWLDLADRFNVVVGQNNSGKSALLEAFRLSRASPDPFRSEQASDPHEIDEQSSFELGLNIAWVDWVEAINTRGGRIWIPVVENGPLSGEDHLAAIRRELSDRTIEVTATAGGSGYRRMHPTSHGIEVTGNVRSVEVEPSRGQRDMKLSSESSALNDTLTELLPAIEPRRIVLLAAQRAIRPRSSLGKEFYLTHNADNLATVINTLRNDTPTLFERLVTHINYIFPDIEYITTPTTGSEVEIRLWPTRNMDKLSKSVELGNSGTGVSQAIAILYVAIYYPSAILVIDEINSFLHPTALKRILTILRNEYAHHQYIISTHSTDVIAWTSPERVFLTKKVDGEAVVQTLKLEEIAGLRELASELGVSMADVFASDRIIWVEGETEEVAFPMVLAKIGRSLPRGTSITSVISTGNLSFGARGVELAYSVYRKVSEFAAPLVSKAVFSFDREGMKPDEVIKLKDMAGGCLFVLPRRMIENYLLHSGAISWLMTEKMDTPTGPSDIEDWILSVGGDPKYRAPTKWNGSLSEDQWLSDVDGAKLLHDTIGHFAGSKQHYQKTTHTPMLIEWLLDNHPKHISELTDYIINVVESAALN